VQCGGAAGGVEVGALEVELAEYVVGGHEAKEADGHDEHHGRGEAQPQGLVGVGAKHVVPYGVGGGGAAGTATHAGRGSGRAARPGGGLVAWIWLGEAGRGGSCSGRR
jgi:hypothetical protein